MVLAKLIISDGIKGGWSGDLPQFPGRPREARRTPAARKEPVPQHIDTQEVRYPRMAIGQISAA